MNYKNKKMNRTNKQNVSYRNAGMKILLTLIICTVIGMGFAMIKKTTQVNADTKGEVMYKSVYIMPGDTVTSIAQEYAVNGYSYKTIKKEIIELNHIDENKITAGCYLLIPYYE